jgi:hypothetical protein
MFWELYQFHRISETDKAASQAKSRVNVNEARLKSLEKRVEALALACQSLWEVASERTKITQEELSLKMEEVDLRDGKSDGRLTPVAKVCPTCQRKSHGARSSCLYCGAMLAGDEHIFGV